MARRPDYTGYKCFYCNKYIYEHMGLCTWNGNICCQRCADFCSERERRWRETDSMKEKES